MELKLWLSNVPKAFLILLIVPYGIETSGHIAIFNLLNLLIVPYGIETPLMCFLVAFLTHF